MGAITAIYCNAVLLGTLIQKKPSCFLGFTSGSWTRQSATISSKFQEEKEEEVEEEVEEEEEQKDRIE